MKKLLLPISLLLLSFSLSAQLSLVKDIRTGITGSAIGEIKVFNGYMYFSANDGTAGAEACPHTTLVLQ